MERRWTHQDIDRARDFYSTHNAGFLPYPWPEELFRDIVDKNNGYFPVTIEALPEGMCAHTHIPVFIITAEGIRILFSSHCPRTTDCYYDYCVSLLTTDR